MSRISSDGYRKALACLVTWNNTDRLAEIDTPTLCIAAADDRTAPVRAVRRLAVGIRGARLEIVERCNHLINVDRPAEFNRLVADFLAYSATQGRSSSAIQSDQVRSRPT